MDPPNLAAWHLVPLRDELRERTGLPVLLDKDVTAAASAEKWAGGRRQLRVLLPRHRRRRRAW